MERSLVVRAQSGDREAFTALALQVSDSLFAVAQRILRDFDGAADALQVTLVRLWRDLPSLEDPARFEAWAYRVLVRACHDSLRARRRQVPQLRLHSSDGAVVSDPATAVSNREELERAFRTLTVEQRTVLVLQYYRDLPLAEIADLLHVPIGTVRSRLHYAKQALRSALDAETRPVPVENVR